MSALAPTYARFPVEFASGSGCVLVDADGNEYLDFLSGISVCNTGHCHPHVVDGRQPHSLLLELFTDAGIGAKVRPAR